jgi:hypothetical protein
MSKGEDPITISREVKGKYEYGDDDQKCKYGN